MWFVLICISMYNYVLCLYLYVSAGIGMYSNNTSEKWLSTKTSIGLYQHVLTCIFVYCTCIDMYQSVFLLYVPAPEPRVWIMPVTSILGRLANPNQYQPIRTNTCEYMNNTYIIHTQYILSEFGLYWAQSLYSFVLTFVLQTKYKLNTYRYMPIHVHTCNTYCAYGDKTCGRHGVRIHANTRKYMPNTSKIHANTYQYETHDDHRFCPRHECIGYVLACICLYLACM